MNDCTEIDYALARLEAWLETMRGPSGALPYGGPVAHWWQQSLLYTGPGYDWRYEGIILGYLALWERTGEKRWLVKACRAGDDLLAGQIANGHYLASAFEGNPASGGTPHEAAASLGLLELAKALKIFGQPEWEQYLSAAKRNLQTYYIEKLWDPQSLAFCDHPEMPTFVPNKAATACQAFFVWSELSGDERWAEVYALPTLERILAHQVSEAGPLQGAIAQNSFKGRLVPRYMPFYIARCIPGLVQGYKWSSQERFLDAARFALDFVLRQRYPDGGLLPAVYQGSQVNFWPQWVAALGDILLAAEMLFPFGIQPSLQELQSRLLREQDISGGIPTACGFASQTGGRLGQKPDLRDILHVVGWCDKAFHWLANNASGAALPPAVSQPYQADCIFQGQNLTFFEDQDRMQAVREDKTVYLWIKGEAWARKASPAFWLH